MDDSVPLRRSTRSSVALKTEELTPRKRKVSTTVEPVTPSRRSTRASSATPKKNLIESLSTPKKTLPILNEEETTDSTTHTPVKKSKEISPKTPSRRRLVRESVSTPTRVSNDKSTKKPVETSEEINVNLNRPLTRAKRKTMGEIQVEEVTKTPLESEKDVQNNKDKPESDKSIQKKKEKPTTPDIDDKTTKSPDSKVEEESSLALVPKVVYTDLKKEQLHEAKKAAEKIVEENECGTFTTKSPVRAEDVAINSPRKIPENCKSISEASMISDSKYINTKSKNVAADTFGANSSVEKTDISSIEDVTVNSSINITSAPDILVTSQKKVIDSGDLGASDVVTCSQKVIDSKGDDIPNIIVTSPSPRKIARTKDNNIPMIFVISPSPRKVPRSKDNKNAKEKDVDVQTAEIQNKDCKESNETSDKVESNDNVLDSAKDVSAEKLPDSDSQLSTEENNVPDANKPVMKNDATHVEIENSKEKNDRTADESFVLNISGLDESHTEENNEEVNTSIIPAVEKQVTTLIENEKSEKDESSGAEAGPSSSDGAPSSSSNITISDVTSSNVSNEKIGESFEETTDESSSVRHTLTDSRSHAGAVQGEGIENKASSGESPIIFRCNCGSEASDDSTDSGIQNDNKLFILNPNFVKTLKTSGLNISQEMVDTVGGIKKPSDPSRKSRDPLDETKVSGSGTIKKSSTGVENDQNIPSAIEGKKETMPENLPENSVSTSLDETLMSANEFLNSDEESNMDCEKAEESGTTIKRNSSSENKPSEDLTKSDVDSTKNSISETENSISLNVILADGLASKEVLTEVHRKQDDCFVDKKPSSSETMNSPDKKEQKSFDISEIKNEQESLTNSRSMSLPDKNEQESLTNSRSLSSPDKNEQESLSNSISLSSPDKNEKESLNNSKTTNSPDKNEQESITNSRSLGSPDKYEQESLNNSETKNSPDKNEPESLNNSETNNSPDKNEQKSLTNSRSLSSPDKNEQESLTNSKSLSSPDKNEQESINNSKTTNSPGKNEQESITDSRSLGSPDKYEQESLTNSRSLSSPDKNEHESIDNSKTTNSPDKNEQESLNNSETKNSPDKKEQTMNSPGINEQKSPINSETHYSPGKNEDENSQTMKSPGKAERNSLINSKNNISPDKNKQRNPIDSETIISPCKVEHLSELAESGTKSNFDFVKKTTKASKNKRPNITESETDNSQSDAESELSYNAPSNAATEGSSEGPLTGKDFIEFEAEEGEETTSEDDSFIVDTDDLSEESSSSSDKRNFNLKLRKRKGSVDDLSPDRRHYIDFVKTLADSSEDDKLQDSSVEKKKRKLEKKITDNKKSQRSKSTLRTEETIVKSSKIRNKSKTDNEVVKELSKVGVFIVSSISQDSEEPKLAQKTKSSKLRTERKKSTILQNDSVPKGFIVNDQSDIVGDEVNLRGFVVSNDESYLVAKKPRKAFNDGSELITRKKKTREGKTVKKGLKKSLPSESKGDDTSGKAPLFVVTLVLPFRMDSEEIIKVLTDKGLTDISSIDLPRRKVAVVKFSNRQHFEKTLELYGELNYKDKPIYPLEGCAE